MRPPVLEPPEMAGILQDFAGSLPATKRLTAVSWTLLAFLCLRIGTIKRDLEAACLLTTLASVSSLQDQIGVRARPESRHKAVSGLKSLPFGRNSRRKSHCTMKMCCD